MKNRWKILSAMMSCAMLLGGCGSERTSEEVLSESSVMETSSTLEESTQETETKETETNETETNETDEGHGLFDNKRRTVVECNISYDANVGSKEEAWAVIQKYGEMQKEKYDNPEVKELETRMEQEFGMAYVCLGEMDLETATDVYTACEYMFTTYPELNGTLTDLTIGNLEDGIILQAYALTRQYEFIHNGQDLPKVIRNEIILDANHFLNREWLLADCALDNGHWPKNANISMIVVHELAHHMLEQGISRRYNFENDWYLTDENKEAYYKVSSDRLSNQQVTYKEVVLGAYEKWCETNQGTEDEFRKSISDYAMGIKDDGGISYTETFAEAIADVYLNGDDAAQASKLIAAEYEKLR